MSHDDARPTARGGFLSRAAVLGVYLPALVFELGMGAVAPVVAVRAGELGADLATAGVLAALLGVGQLLGDVPAGALASRVGDRAAMLVASAVAVVALAGCALADRVGLLAVAALALGATNAVFMLARQSYVTGITPVLYRARALSTLGGVGRIGVFLGPFLGAAVMHLTDTTGAFWLAVVTTALAVVVLLAVPDVEGPQHRRGPRASVLAVAREHRHVLLTLGAAVLLVGAVRGARQQVVPLWGEHLGLAPATTSLVYGVAGALDVLLFYPAGRVMDRRGRLAVAVPSMLLVAAALLVLPTTSTAAGLAAVAVLLGAGNGVSSGLLMTLGSDVAPPGERSAFLGVWRLLQDSGSAAGPLVVSAGAALGSLAAGVLAAGTLGVAAAGALARTVPRWSVHASRRTRLAAGLRPDGRPAAPGGTAA
ncbi:MFS transporter [Cellulomonas sp. JZ18]|uniref:MFS transporter n=1 Tax=Cellulomonas sp. JZ18 TaxID=2654191 RepID=UPI0012D4B2AC|nr:MFS transporter [Cellulomonas sp. JZ18]QGQ20333.1 MFS transporter [Cellulomonas sp. JZ18]